MRLGAKFILLAAALFLLGLIFFGSAASADAATLELDPDEYEGITGRYWAHGFIASKAEFDKIKKGEVRGGLSGNIIIGLNEIFLGTFQADEKPFLGERYMAVRTGAEVYMAGGSQKIGATIGPLAIIEIAEISGVSFRGKIVKMRQPLMRGDNVVGFKPRRGAAEGQKPGPKTLEATILASRDDKLILGPDDVVYLDIGRANGASSGQAFDIFSKSRAKRDLSEKSLAARLWLGGARLKAAFERPDLIEPILIGKLMLTSVRETTSAAIIVESKREVLPGDTVKLIVDK